MPHINKTFVETAKPPASNQEFYRDDTIKGFGLRVMASGVKSFVFEGRINKRPRRITIGQYPAMTVADARKYALEICAAIARGEDPAEDVQAQRHEATFGDLVERYMEHARLHLRPRSIKHNEFLLARYVPAGWRTRSLSAITRDDVERLHATVGQQHGLYAANHCMRLLRHMFNMAYDWKMLLRENPAARIKLFKEQKRERFLSPEELARVNQALLEEADWRWRTYFPMALMLGTRKSELLAMRWSDIDLNARTWRIPETKAGNTHLLPLPAPVVAMLESLPSRGQGEWVFPGESKTGHIVEPERHGSE